MKTAYKIVSAIICVAIFLSSCSREDSNVPEMAKVSFLKGNVEVTDPATKTQHEFSDNTLKVRWNNGDAIVVSDGKSLFKFTQAGELSNDGRTALFASETSVNFEAGDLVAVYPYASDLVFDITSQSGSLATLSQTDLLMARATVSSTSIEDFVFVPLCATIKLPKGIYINDSGFTGKIAVTISGDNVGGKIAISKSGGVVIEKSSITAPVNVSNGFLSEDLFVSFIPVSKSGNYSYEVKTSKGDVFSFAVNNITTSNVYVVKTPFDRFYLETYNLRLPYEAVDDSSVKLVCSGDWSITIPSSKPSWLLGISPVSGSGNSTITIKTGTNTVQAQQSCVLTVRSGAKTLYLTVIKEASPNIPPSKPTGLKPSGSNVETITTFSWNASTDANGDKVKYTVMLSKDNAVWTSFDATDKTTMLNKEPLDKNTKYYYKVVADDGLSGGKTESDVVTFTTGSTKSYWADGEVKLYEVNSDGSITEVSSTSRPFKLIYTGDGYTQDLFKYGGQFDKEIEAGIKALFEIEPYKQYYYYFAVYKVAAYSNEAGMSSGSTDWSSASTKKDTKFKCSWQGGNSTGIGCNTETVIEYASKCPGYTGSTYDIRTKLSWSPICIIINANQYAGTNIWMSGMGGMKMISIAQVPARHPASSSYGGFANTLRHEFGGHGIGLLGDEYVYYSTSPYPVSNQSTFRYWQGIGAYSNIYLPQWNSTNNSWYSDSEHCNLSLTASVEGQNWKSFADRTEYSSCNIKLHSGAVTYGVGVYRSENSSCMINNIPHFNTFSRWKIYCRIKLTAGETPSIEDFIAHDYDKTNSYGSAAPMTKSSDERRCEGPLLIDPYHSKPYHLR